MWGNKNPSFIQYCAVLLIVKYVEHALTNVTKIYLLFKIHQQIVDMIAYNVLELE